MRGRQKGSHNRAVRFYFDVWSGDTAQLDRDERNLYFALLVDYWRRREPIKLARIRIEFGDELPELDRLIAAGLLLVEGDGYVPITARRMAISRGRPEKAAWSEIVWRIFQRDNFTCRYCGDRGGHLECDHVVPLSRGGSNDDENLVTACRPCNRRKSDRTAEEMGWTI